MAIGKHPPCLDRETLRSEQLPPSRREGQPSVRSRNGPVIARTGPAVSWRNIDSAAALGRPQAVVEVTHTVYENRINVSYAINDGF